ncbi:MAG: hypothetical protein AB7N76_28985 [Planctomycetota bacterium]
MIRLIPGAPGVRPLQLGAAGLQPLASSEARALVLTDEATLPAVAWENKSTRVSAPANVTRLSPSPRMAAGLPPALRVYRAEAQDLPAGESYVIRASAGASTAAVDFRTVPDEIPNEGLTVAVASCFYDGFAMDAAYLATLRQSNVWFGEPAFKLLIGDNLYLDVAKSAAQYSDGYQETAAHYARYFWRTDYADVLSYLPTLTTWDDHEFWNNYPESQPWLARSRGNMRIDYHRAGHEGIDLFQAPLNPPGVAPGLPAPRSYAFNVGFLSFFVADTRTQRTLNGAHAPRFMPTPELEALEAWAAGLQGPGVLVVGQPLWLGTGSWTDFNLTDFTEQYRRLWAALSTAPYDVLVVSGDVHHSRWIQFGLPGQRSIYEFVTSPASCIPTIGSVITGSYKTQDSGEVNFPAQVPLDRARANPRYSRYLFGAGPKAPNSIGLLHFVPGPQKSVSVGGAFLNVATKALAASEDATIKDGLFHSRKEQGSYSTNGLCQTQPRVRLGKR